jgi:hypothetical protein
MNFAWIIFRKQFSPGYQAKFHEFFTTQLKADLMEFQSRIPENINKEYSIDNYNHTYRITEKKMVQDILEIGLFILINQGIFTYRQPFFRVLIGLDSILFYFQRVDLTQFGFIFTNNAYIELISRFTQEKLHQFQTFLEKELQSKNKRDFRIIAGDHSCWLNCGGCCDGADHTRSPLLGGRYCKALTPVGNFCLYRLFSPARSPEHPVCAEYRCGLLQNPYGEEAFGTEVYRFPPAFNAWEREELFTIMDAVDRGEPIEQVFSRMSRTQEVDHYFAITERIQFLLEELHTAALDNSRINQFIEAFLFALSRNYPADCRALIAQYRADLEERGPVADRLGETLYGFEAWLEQFSYRRRQIPPTIMPIREL